MALEEARPALGLVSLGSPNRRREGLCGSKFANGSVLLFSSQNWLARIGLKKVKPPQVRNLDFQQSHLHLPCDKS